MCADLQGFVAGNSFTILLRAGNKFAHGPSSYRAGRGRKPAAFGA
jgi:hypothetical protein